MTQDIGKNFKRSLNKGIHKIEAFGANLGQGLQHVSGKMRLMPGAKEEDPDFNRAPEIASGPSFAEEHHEASLCSNPAPMGNNNLGRRPTLDASDAIDEGDEAGSQRATSGHVPLWWSNLKADTSERHYFVMGVREARHLAAVDHDTRSTTS